MTPWLYKLPLRFRSLLRKGRVEQELTEELRFHLEKLIEEKVGTGVAPQEARYAALRELGGVEQIKEECRGMRRVNYIEGFFQDVRYGLRMLSRNPGFSAVAALSLAIGIGINATAFSIVDALLLRSLPLKNAKQMVRINALRQGRGRVSSYAEYQDICRQSTAFAGILASSGHMALLEQHGEVEMIQAELVSENYFTVLGIHAAMGRTFVEGEDVSGHAALPAVISYGLWKRHFGADPVVVGKTVLLNRYNFVVLGVAPPSFGGLKGVTFTEVWFPLKACRNPQDLQNRGFLDYELLGRLLPGANIERARAELDTIAGRLAGAYPDTNRGTSYTALTEGERIHQKLPAAAILLAAVFLILVICCTNVSGMILAWSPLVEKRDLSSSTTPWAGITFGRWAPTSCAGVTLTDTRSRLSNG